MPILQNVPWDRVDIRVLLVEVEHSDKAAIRKFMEEQHYQYVRSINNDQDFVFVSEKHLRKDVSQRRREGRRNRGVQNGITIK